jgi:hypothetical protein
LKYFGKTASGIAYAIHDLTDRVSHLEKHKDYTDPIIGATIARLEGFISVVSKDSLRQDFLFAIDDVTSKIISGSKKNNIKQLGDTKWT